MFFVTRLLYTSLFGVPKRRAFQRDRNVRLNSCSMLLVLFWRRETPCSRCSHRNKGGKNNRFLQLQQIILIGLPRTHTLYIHEWHLSHTHTPSKKRRHNEKTKERKETPKQTNKNMSNHEFGRSIIANIQEANYKNCQYHFPLNSHNKKQPLLIWGEKHASLKR